MLDEKIRDDVHKAPSCFMKRVWRERREAYLKVLRNRSAKPVRHVDEEQDVEEQPDFSNINERNCNKNSSWTARASFLAMVVLSVALHRR
jgi:hypothetical protein